MMVGWGVSLFFTNQTTLCGENVYLTQKVPTNLPDPKARLQQILTQMSALYHTQVYLVMV